jgi:exodeoxyribonuclease VII large subunit
MTLFPDDRHDAMSIGDLLTQVQRAVATAFPRGPGIWVRGEIQTFADHRSGHCYMDLVDPESPRGRERPVLKVNCWRTTWGPIRRILSQQGISLQPGMVVTLRGRVELYAPRAQVNFIASDVDVAALVGRMAAQRAALLAALEKEGLLTRNRSLPVPAVPLTVGLVASPRTEGFEDFLGQLRSSGFGFTVRLAAVPVQGTRAPAAIANGLVTVSRARPDVTVLVRGGGAKADLGAFDTEQVARAVAVHPFPVWTGIGHTGDQSVADVVANRAFVTPTECGQELARTVGAWHEGTCAAGLGVARRARHVVDDALAHHTRARHRLAGSARGQLRGHDDRVGSRAARLALHARRQVETSSAALEGRAARVGPVALAVVDRESDRITSLRRLLDAYDVERQLERGYTLTLDDEGRIVRSSGQVLAGQALLTRFADGTVRSRAEGPGS